MSKKLETVSVPSPVNKPYIRGTMAGNLFLIVSNTPDGIVAFRPLDTKVPKEGTAPAQGVSTRVRAVPVEDSPETAILFERFGFNRVADAEGVHYSIVTEDPASAIKDAAVTLKVA